MKRVLVGAVVVALGFAVYAFLRRGTGPEDGKQLVERAAMLHRGTGPCLRYGFAPSSPEAIASIAEQLANAAIPPDEILAAAGHLYFTVAQEQERASHAKSMAEELYDESLRGAGPLARLLAPWLVRPRAEQIARGFEEAFVHYGRDSLQRWSAIPPEHQRVFERVWQEFPGALFADRDPIAQQMKEGVTRAHMERIAAAVADHRRASGDWPLTLHELSLPAELVRDGWGHDISLRLGRDGELHLYSNGPDGKSSWGEGDDLIWGRLEQ